MPIDRYLPERCIYLYSVISPSDLQALGIRSRPIGSGHTSWHKIVLPLKPVVLCCVRRRFRFGMRNVVYCVRFLCMEDSYASLTNWCHAR